MILLNLTRLALSVCGAESDSSLCTHMLLGLVAVVLGNHSVNCVQAVAAVCVSVSEWLFVCVIYVACSLFTGRVHAV